MVYTLQGEINMTTLTTDEQKQLEILKTCSIDTLKFLLTSSIIRKKELINTFKNMYPLEIQYAFLEFEKYKIIIRHHGFWKITPIAYQLILKLCKQDEPILQKQDDTIESEELQHVIESVENCEEIDFKDAPIDEILAYLDKDVSKYFCNTKTFQIGEFEKVVPQYVNKKTLKNIIAQLQPKYLKRDKTFLLVQTSLREIASQMLRGYFHTEKGKTAQQVAQDELAIMNKYNEEHPDENVNDKEEVDTPKKKKSKIMKNKKPLTKVQKRWNELLEKKLSGKPTNDELQEYDALKKKLHLTTIDFIA